MKHHERFGPHYLCDLTSDPFWKDIFVAYAQLYDNIQLQQSQEILAEPLFCNTKFKIDCQPFCYKNWIIKGIFTVKQLMTYTGNFLYFSEFKSRYDIHVNLLEYYGCTSSIKKYLQESKIKIESNQCNSLPTAASKLKTSPKGSNTFYNVVVNS